MRILQTIFFLWGYLSLIVPSKVFLGPMTPAGDVPRWVLQTLDANFWMFSPDTQPTESSSTSFHFSATSSLSTSNPSSRSRFTRTLPKSSPPSTSSRCSSVSGFWSKGTIDQRYQAKALMERHFYIFFKVAEGSLDKPLPYQFYAGIELHPRMLGNECSRMYTIIM